MYANYELYLYTSGSVPIKSKFELNLLLLHLMDRQLPTNLLATLECILLARLTIECRRRLLLGGPEACSPGKFLNFGSSEMAFP